MFHEVTNTNVNQTEIKANSSKFREFALTIFNESINNISIAFAQLKTSYDYSIIKRLNDQKVNAENVFFDGEEEELTPPLYDLLEEFNVKKLNDDEISQIGKEISDLKKDVEKITINVEEKININDYVVRFNKVMAALEEKKATINALQEKKEIILKLETEISKNNLALGKKIIENLNDQHAMLSVYVNELNSNFTELQEPELSNQLKWLLGVVKNCYSRIEQISKKTVDQKFWSEAITCYKDISKYIEAAKSTQLQVEIISKSQREKEKYIEDLKSCCAKLGSYVEYFDSIKRTIPSLDKSICDETYDISVVLQTCRTGIEEISKNDTEFWEKAEIIFNDLNNNIKKAENCWYIVAEKEWTAKEEEKKREEKEKCFNELKKQCNRLHLVSKELYFQLETEFNNIFRYEWIINERFKNINSKLNNMCVSSSLELNKLVESFINIKLAASKLKPSLSIDERNITNEQRKDLAKKMISYVT